MSAVYMDGVASVHANRASQTTSGERVIGAGRQRQTP